MQSCHIPHQIIETVSCNTSCSIHIQTAKTLHNVCMVGNGKIRNKRLSKAFIFHITAIILSNGYRRINHIRNHHHAFQNLFLQHGLLLFQFGKSFGESGNFFLYLLRFFLFSFSHKGANLLGNLVFLTS